MTAQGHSLQADREADLIRRAADHDEAAIRAIIRLYNGRLFRVARGIVKDDGEAEDALQEAYLRAFGTLKDFRGGASLATWLTRIVINEALQRMRRRREQPLDETAAAEPAPHNVVAFPLAPHAIDPERAVAQSQIARMVERAIDALPDDFRVVLVARILEDLSIEETADLLSLRPETVKTRLHRARRLLKEALAEHVDPLLADVFPFGGSRCDRIADIVVARMLRTA